MKVATLRRCFRPHFERYCSYTGRWGVRKDNHGICTTSPHPYCVTHLHILITTSLRPPFFPPVRSSFLDVINRGEVSVFSFTQFPFVVSFFRFVFASSFSQYSPNRYLSWIASEVWSSGRPCQIRFYCTSSTWKAGKTSSDTLWQGCKPEETFRKWIALKGIRSAMCLGLQNPVFGRDRYVTVLWIVAHS